MSLYAVITYRCDGKIYNDWLGVTADTTKKEMIDMFQMNHSMDDDLKKLRVISIQYGSY